MELHPLRVFVVSDDPLAKAGLITLLSSQREFIVVGTSTIADLTSEALEIYSPEILIWDVGWEMSPVKKSDQIQWTNQISDIAKSGLPVLTLVSDAHQAHEAWSAGALGLLSRTKGGPEIAAAARAIMEGLLVCETTFDEEIFPDLTMVDPIPIEPLTDREIEVLQNLAEGLSNKAIAVRLDISEHTVKFHVNTIFRKLSVQSRTEAVVRAYRLGLILI